MRFPNLRHPHLLLLVSSVRFSNWRGTKHFFRMVLLLSILTASRENLWAQTWISAVSASTTTSTAKVSWVTAVPSDSQVEYGTTASYGKITALATAKVTTHSVAWSGLTGGTTYHFRVRSNDANGVLVVGPDYTLTISVPVTVALSPQNGTVAANGAQQFTATVKNHPNQAVTWSATAGTVSFSGLFTAPNVTSTTSVTVIATSQADTTKTASTTLSVSAGPPADTVLIGQTTVETPVNGLPGGTAEGYQMTALAAGTLTTLGVYVDASTSASNLFVGLYSDNNGHPGTRLTGGSSSTFQKPAWNTVSVSPVTIAVGSKYWFVLLATGGRVRFRQIARAGGWIDELNAVRTLTSLPSTWTTGTIYGGGAWTSVYGSGNTLAGPLSTAVLSVSPMTLSWTAQVGTSNLAADSVNVTNTGSGALAYTGASDQPWLLISSTSGTAPATIQIHPTTAGLKAGTYTGHVTLTGGGATKTVTAVLSMTSPPPVQHAVLLSWKNPAGATVVSHSLYRSTVRGSSYGLLASAVDGTTYTDESTQPGTLYYYVVTAVDSQGRESSYSNEAEVAIP
jgi:Viral BACON domain